MEAVSIIKQCQSHPLMGFHLQILKQQKESTTKLVLYHKCVSLHSFLLNEKKSWEIYLLYFSPDCIWWGLFFFFKLWLRY